MTTTVELALTIIVLTTGVNQIICLSFWDGPIGCINSTNSVATLVDCIDPYIIQEDTVTYEDWIKTARPGPDFMKQFTQVVKLMLNQKIDCTDAHALDMHLAVAGPMQLFHFHDKVHNSNHCVLMERSFMERNIPGESTTRLYFHEGHGMFIAPAPGAPIRYPGVHFSAAHPQTDGPVHKQAGALYGRLGVHSVMITGTTRWAVQHPGDCQVKYKPMDAAHSNETLFHAALLETLRWQMNEGGGCHWGLGKPSENCLFVQFHGMRDVSCKDDVTIFNSVGGKPDVAGKFYNDPNSAINLLDAALEAQMPSSWGIHTPSQTENCNLVAAGNVFGRVVNGVPIGSECGTPATTDGIIGAFIHIEQKKSVSSQTDHNQWQHAFEIALNYEKDSSGDVKVGTDNNNVIVGKDNKNDVSGQTGGAVAIGCNYWAIFGFISVIMVALII